MLKRDVLPGVRHKAGLLKLEMPMSFPVLHVANSILEKSFVEEEEITHMKLQKMIYCLHGWHLAIRGTPAIEEPVEAWKYGPVAGSLYHKFRTCGTAAIESYGREERDGKRVAVIVNKLQGGFYEILEHVWRKCVPMTALQLSSLAHAPGTPWEQARESGNWFVSNASIGHCYRSLLRG